MENNEKCVCQEEQDKNMGVCPTCEKQEKDTMGFVERMQQERDELNVRREKLQKFIDSEAFKALDIDNQVLLSMQFNCMANYEMILDKRIEINLKVK